MTVTLGAVGAADDSTCRPRLYAWPGTGFAAHPSPVQVIEVRTFTEQVMPQALTTLVTFESGQVTLHEVGVFVLFTDTSAMYPPGQELCNFQAAVTLPAVTGFTVAVGFGVGFGTGFVVGFALGVGVGFFVGVTVGFVVGVGALVGVGFTVAAGVGTGSGVVPEPIRGLRAASFAVWRVVQSSFTSPPVSPLLGLNDQ